MLKGIPNDPVVPIIWDDYKKLIGKDGNDSKTVLPINKFEFYDRAKKACAVVTTSEAALYANIILKKGVVVE